MKMVALKTQHLPAKYIESLKRGYLVDVQRTQDP